MGGLLGLQPSLKAMYDIKKGGILSKRKLVHILSGGLDSTTLLYHLLADKKYDVIGAITFRYGQRHCIETSFAQDTIKFIKEHLFIDIPHKVIDISGIGKLLTTSALTGDIDMPEGHYEEEKMKLTVVPNRNMAFLSLCAMYALTEKGILSLGVHAGDHAVYPDTRQEFIDAFVKTVKIGNWGAENFEVYTPFINLHKGQIVQVGIEAAKKLGVHCKSIFGRTQTCYKGGDKACGKCGSCSERIEAMKFAGIEDPIVYEEDI